jgi:nitrogen fixation/metabolism regulation signal transduction histidine kinase
MIDNKDYTIQGRQLPFDQNETISIGFETEIDGEFYISIDEADGFFTHQKVYLKDNLLGIEQDLKQTAYKFSTEAGIFKDRFELKFTNKTLTTNELQTASEPVIVTAFKNQIKVNSTNEEISSILIYDITGKKLLSKNNINKNEITIEKPSNQNGVYLVKIKLADAQELTRKVIF